MRPLYYSYDEGRPLIPWVSGHVWEHELEAKWRARPAEARHIWINNIQVHALIWPDGRAWDAVNRWRTGTHWLRRIEEHQSGRCLNLNSDACNYCDRPLADWDGCCSYISCPMKHK